MKKLWLFVMATSFTAVSTFAQEQKETAPEKATAQKEVQQDWDKKIKDELKLTDEQVVKYDALKKEYKEKIDAVMNDASLAKDAQKEKKMTLKKEKEAKLLEILTPDQQSKYKDMMRQNKEAMDKKKETKSGI